MYIIGSTRNSLAQHLPSLLSFRFPLLVGGRKEGRASDPDSETLGLVFENINHFLFFDLSISQFK